MFLMALEMKLIKITENQSKQANENKNDKVTS